MSRRGRTVAPAVRCATASWADGPAEGRYRAGAFPRRGAAALATALLTGAVVASAAVSAAAADGDVQVRRTSPAGDSAVQLAVLPGPSDVTSGDAAASSVGPVRVTQAGRRLPADTQRLVAPGHPLAVVVLVRPEELSAAQGLVADALATLPENVRVSLAPVSAGASSGPVSPSEALAGLDRLIARPSASGIVAGGSAGSASPATLLVTTCPQGRLPDVGAAAGWVLGWGAGCGSEAPGASTGLVAQRESTLADARSALPGLMAQVLAARSVRVTPAGSEPLAVTASGTRTTVLLTGGPAAADPAVGSAAGGRGAAAAPAGTGSTRTATSPELRVVPLVEALGVGAVGAAALTGVVLLLLRRRRAAARSAWGSTSTGDDPWSGLVPEWRGPRDEGS